MYCAENRISKYRKNILIQVNIFKSLKYNNIDCFKVVYQPIFDQK